MKEKSIRKDRLNWRDLVIFQNPAGFCFSLDVVLLADFATIKPKDKVCDLGCGNGVLPLLLWSREPKAQYTGLEIQKEPLELAKKSLAQNGEKEKGLSQNICLIEGDLCRASELLGRGGFSLVVSNPPYMPKGTGRQHVSQQIKIAKSEELCTLADVIREGSALLNTGGRFAMVHRPQRLAEMMQLMAEYQLVPKRLRLVEPAPKEKSNMVLIEAVKQGRQGLLVLPSLVVYSGPQVYSKEIEEILAGRNLKKPGK